MQSLAAKNVDAELDRIRNDDDDAEWKLGDAGEGLNIRDFVEKKSGQAKKLRRNREINQSLPAPSHQLGIIHVMWLLNGDIGTRIGHVTARRETSISRFLSVRTCSAPPCLHQGTSVSSAYSKCIFDLETVS